MLYLTVQDISKLAVFAAVAQQEEVDIIVDPKIKAVVMKVRAEWPQINGQVQPDGWQLVR